ncbi:MAG: SDR family oxidoreductase [Cryobacterium sp.]|nr:SDR family oxidoreductase [Cryobacterium sp.]
MKLAIAGATGTVGKHVARIATERGHTVVPLSRSNGIDLETGVGLPEALKGVDAVIDVCGTSAANETQAIEFFKISSRNLLKAEKDAGVAHHVTLSIVGIDKINSGYYAGKVAQEETVKSGEVAWSILRATQFHEFAVQMLALSAGPIAIVPKAITQPIAAAEVAAALVDLAEKKPAGRVNDLGGPKVEDLGSMAKRYLAANGQKRWVLALPLPGKFFKGLRDGSILPDASATLGKQTFENWLKDLPKI